MLHFYFFISHCHMTQRSYQGKYSLHCTLGIKGDVGYQEMTVHFEPSWPLGTPEDTQEKDKHLGLCVLPLALTAVRRTLPSSPPGLRLHVLAYPFPAACSVPPAPGSYIPHMSQSLASSHHPPGACACCEVNKGTRVAWPR